MTLGVILFFLFWTSQLIIITSFFGIIIGSVYLISLPILAWFNYKYWILILKTIGKWNYLNLKKKNKLVDAKNSYDEILSIIEKL